MKPPLKGEVDARNADGGVLPLKVEGGVF